MLRLAVLAAMLFPSCELLKPGEPIEFTTVEGYASPLHGTPRANYVFQDSASLRDFWIKYCQDTIVIPLRPPHVDFSTRTLICVFMGSCPSTGYSTTIFEVRDFGDQIVASIAEEGGGVGCAILTYPQHLVTIPKTNLPIEFRYDKIVRDDHFE